MSDLSNTVCPVCSGVSPDRAKSDECPFCHSPNAFCFNFASKKSLLDWQKDISAQKERRMLNLQNILSRYGCLSVNRTNVAFLNPYSHKLTVIDGKGRTNVYSDVKQYSLGENHMLILRMDGTVKAIGDNSSGQCVVSDFKNISFVAAAPECTYAVTERGRVIVRGACSYADVIEKQWSGVKSIACGMHCTLGLTNDGKVLCFRKTLAPESIMKVTSWENVKSLAVSLSNSVLGLFNDGEIDFKSRDGDIRSNNMRDWHNILAIGIESQYALALNDKGRIRLSGEYNQALDKGRLDAAEWKDIIAIACGRACIGAIDINGKLYLAGNIQEHGKHMLKSWELPVETLSEIEYNLKQSHSEPDLYIHKN